MLRRRHSLPLLLLLPLVFAECSDSGGGFSYSDLQTIVPMKVGSSWTYLDITPSSLPTFPDDSTIVHSWVSGFADSGATRIYAMSGFIGEGDSGIFSESVTRSQYRRYRDDDRGDRILVATILQLPIERGNTWYVNGHDDSEGFAVISNPDTTLRIPSGEFRHVIFVRELNGSGNEWGIKPGVGIVYERHFGDAVITRQLIATNF